MRFLRGACPKGRSSSRPRVLAAFFRGGGGEVTTVGEAQDGQRKAIELSLDWSAHDEHSLGDLVERLEALSPDHRYRVWELIAAWNDTGPTDSQKVELRERGAILVRRWK